MFSGKVEIKLYEIIFISAFNNDFFLLKPRKKCLDKNLKKIMVII
jgi:hypothetical protein